MKFKEFLKTGKAKVLTVAGLGLVGASSAFADLTYTPGKGFDGTIDFTPFYTAAAIVASILGVVFAVKTGLSMFKR